MAERANAPGFFCAPDFAFTEVDKLTSITGLMTKEGLDFIREIFSTHRYFRGSLTKETNWHLAFIDAAAPIAFPLSWIDKNNTSARVFLLLGKSTLLLYSGSESLDKYRDEKFHLLRVNDELFESKIADNSVTCCKLELDGGLIAYDGRMAYQLLQGRMYIFGFVPEAGSGQFEKGRAALVLPSSLKEEAKSLNTANVTWHFHFKANQQ